jgi:transcriptional regulator with XRE-family HTH domain
MVEIPTQSSGVGEKIRAIRDAEGLTRQQFFELTGIPAGTQSITRQEEWRVLVAISCLRSLSIHVSQNTRSG